MTSHLVRINMRNLLFILLLSMSTLAMAQRGIPDAPNPPRLVNDLTGSTLSQREVNALENKLLGYEDSTSTQVAILIVESLNGYEIADFAQRTGQKWGVGQSKDNGVLVVVAIQERRMNISTGYGMEGVIPDAAAFTIIQDYLQPNFRENNYYRGLDEATDVIFKLASGEYKAETFGQNRKRSSDDGGKGFPFVTLFILFFFIIPAIAGKRRRGGIGSRGIPWWVWLMMGSGGNHRHNDWDDFKGGRGGFGGGSGFGGGGGGFGGFGGGGFGGGGASGSW